MPYNQLGRIVHDADAHIMEPPTWLRDHADPSIRDRVPTLDLSGGNELKQTGSVDEQLADPDAALQRPTPPHRRHPPPPAEAAEAAMRQHLSHSAEALRQSGKSLIVDP